MNAALAGRRKPWNERALVVRTVGSKKLSGSKTNKRNGVVATRASDSAGPRRPSRVVQARTRTAGTVAEAPVAEAPLVAVFGLRDLEEMRMANLQALAKNLGLKGYSKLKKDDLIEFIYTSEENQQ